MFYTQQVGGSYPPPVISEGERMSDDGDSKTAWEMLQEEADDLAADEPEARDVAALLSDVIHQLIIEGPQTD